VLVRVQVRVQVRRCCRRLVGVDVVAAPVVVDVLRSTAVLRRVSSFFFLRRLVVFRR
jgi:hypothetical protein